MSLIDKLIAVQTTINVPKGNFNKFGGYNYRSVEDIQEAAKPICKLNGVALIVSDELVLIGDRYYVKATATITDGESSITNTAYAREPETVKGQSEAQITGSSSSYARKYALGGLLLLDDVKDPDATNDHGKKQAEQIKTLDLKKLNELVDLFNTLEQQVQTIILKKYKIADIRELPAELWDKAIEGISKAKK